MKVRVIFSLFILFSSCGYQCWDEGLARAISIPYVVGDEDGAFTSELIRQFSSHSSIQVAKDSPYRLDVKIVQDGVEPIGYRRDPQKIRGKIRKNLVENEARKTIGVDVAIYDHNQTAPVFGPLHLVQDVDYDYVDADSLQDLQFQNASGQKFNVLPFSLGQLESSEAAQEAAVRPLYQKLSQKIVETISTQWALK